MRPTVWKKTAMTAMKQHGFQKNIINHAFYCEWPHCLAVVIFEEDGHQGMKVRLDIFTYNFNQIIDLAGSPDASGYLTRDQATRFEMNVSKEEVYDQIIAALQETIPILIGNRK